MAEITVSDGASLANPDILCPTTGQICPALEQLVELYEVKEVDATIAANIPRECNPLLDGAKFHLRLSEYAARARVSPECAGPDGNICPTRLAMDEDRTRQTAVRGLRALFRRNT